MASMIPGEPPRKGTVLGLGRTGRQRRAAPGPDWPRPATPLPGPGLWVVVLAAGGSRRFGRPKLLQRLGPATLLRRAALLGRRVAPTRCVVVLGARASRLAAELRGTGVRWIVNRRWNEGLSSSLRVAIAALPRDTRAALVLLADQYAVQPQDLDRLIGAWRRRPGRIVASGWDGLRGPPAVLPRKVFPRTRRLAGDAGARQLLRDPALPVEVVAMPAARFDLDRPGDLAAGRRCGRPDRG